MVYATPKRIGLQCSLVIWEVVAWVELSGIIQAFSHEWKTKGFEFHLQSFIYFASISFAYSLSKGELRNSETNGTTMAASLNLFPVPVVMFNGFYISVVDGAALQVIGTLLRLFQLLSVRPNK